MQWRGLLIFDSVEGNPSWHKTVRESLEIKCGLPVTDNVEEASRAQTLLILTSHLDAEKRRALADVPRKLVLITGLYAQKFSFIAPNLESCLAEEQAVLEWADFVSLPSEHARQIVLRFYGDDLASKLIVAGLPVNIDRFSSDHTTPRDDKLILLGQRQDYDKNFLLEADICTYLKEDGYRFLRASNHRNPALKDFAEYAEQHLGIPSKGNPENYAAQCLASKFVLLTSPAETLCITAIEAVAAGCIPIVPDHSAFKEWCHRDNRYEPYSISEIRRILRDSPVRPHAIEQYRPEVFINKLRAGVESASSIDRDLGAIG
jgi:hypothetical protein